MSSSPFPQLFPPSFSRLSAALCWLAALSLASCTEPSSNASIGTDEAAAGDDAEVDESAALFSVPIWSPEARWEIDRLGATLSRGHLGGPVEEAEFHHVGLSDLASPDFEGGRTYLSWFDPQTRQAFEAIGSARGFLDGPFSRARFGGWDYVFTPHALPSPGRRYLFVNDKRDGKVVIRRLDFESQQVKTLPEFPGYLGMTGDAQGNLYVVTSLRKLLVLNNEGKLLRELPLEFGSAAASGFLRWFPLALDEKHRRLYSASQAGGWYLFYWDLADGSFHGVVPIAQQRRPRNQPGPFEGVDWYHEGATLQFASAATDPDRRFLYLARVDTYQLFRLDLERKQVAALVVEGNTARFSETEASAHPPVYARFRMVGQDFVTLDGQWAATYRFRRVK